MRAQSFLYFITLFGLLTAGLAAPVSAQAPISLPPSYEANLNASEGDVYGNWQRSLERVAFYLDHDNPFQQIETPDGGVLYVPDRETEGNGFYHYEPPVGVIPYEQTTSLELSLDANDPADKRALLTVDPVDGFSEALFTMPTTFSSGFTYDLNPTRPYHLYGFEATLYVSCPSYDLQLSEGYLGDQGSIIAEGIGVNLRIQEYDAEGNSIGYRDFSTSTSNTQHFLGNSDVGTTEVVPTQISVVSGSAVDPIFQVKLQMNNLGNFDRQEPYRGFTIDPSFQVPQFSVRLIDALEVLDGCVLHYGSQQFPSNFVMTTDTGTVNTWIDDKDGDFTVGLPSAEDTSQEQRRMTAVTAQGSAWNGLNSFKVRQPEPVNYQDLAWSGQLYRNADMFPDADDDYTILSNGADRLYTRWRAEDDNSVLFDTRTGDNDQVNRPIKLVPGSRSVEVFADGLNLIQEKYLYTTELPDGSYHFELYSLRQRYATSTTAIVGLKGFDFELFESPGETDLRHQVERQEPTVYRLMLRNLGAQEDTITLRATGGGTGWTISMPQTRATLPAAGPITSEFGHEVLLTVTPGANLQVGAETEVTVTATSKYTQEVAPQEIKLTTTIVEEKVPAVDLFGGADLVQVSPGDKLILQDLFVHNKGSSADTYIVEAKLPGGIGVGWTTRALPPGKLIDADSIEDFAIEVNVAADAKPGQRITLPVSARLAGGSTDASVVDVLEIPIEVILEHGLGFTVIDDIHPLRKVIEDCSYETEVEGTAFTPSIVAGGRELGADYADTCSIGETDQSQTTFYHLRITNPAPVDETFVLRGDWEGGAVNGIGVKSFGNSNSCDGDRNPDFWRMDYGKTGDAKLNGVPGSDVTDDPTAASALLETLVIPAGQTIDRWVELGYIYNEGFEIPLLDCGYLDISPAARYRVVATPVSEPGNKAELILGAFLNPTTDKIHGVSLEPYFHGATSTFTPLSKESQLTDQTFEEVRYRVVARNEANEKDTLSISAVLPPGLGWTQTLEFRGDLSPSPSQGCQNAQGLKESQSWTCKNMGSYGEVVFDLIVRPGASASVGTSLPSTVTLVSKDDGLKTDVLSFTTKLVGERLFSSATTVGARSAEPGQEVNMPFFIDNQGTRDDTYSVVMTSGNRDYKPRFSIDDQVFVPGAHRLDAYLHLQVPEDAVKGDSEVFTVLVTSSDPALGPVTLSFRVDVIEDSGIIVRSVDGGNNVLIRERDVEQDVGVEAIVASATNGDPITFRVDRAKLPTGWTVATPKIGGALGPHQAGFSAIATFGIKAPANALGTSTVPLIVDVCLDIPDNCLTNADFIASGDIILDLQDDVGIALVLEDPDVARATLPGGDVVYPIRVENRGLSADLVELTNTAPGKPGWTISYDPPFLSLAPLESRVVDVIASSPSTAAPGERIDFLLFATSGVDPSEFDQMALSAEIGVFKLEVKDGTPVASLAPGETRSFVTTVYNNGTLPDAVFGTADLAGAEAQAAYSNIVDTNVFPAGFELQPGQSKDVTVTVTVGPSIAPKVTVPVEVDFTSVPNAPVKATSTFDVKILDYRARDVDGDGIVEYAIDRDGKSSNGFEEFRDAVTNAGTQTQPAHLVRFLNADGIARHSTKATVNGTVVTITTLFIDGDISPSGDFGDGRADLFLDDTGDGLPDLYWDPDDGHSHRIQIFKDIDADGVPDYFVDTSGNGDPDAVYNLAQGTFVGLLARDVDNDGILDYVVDKNGNGLADKDETILFTKDGKLVQVTKVDVDGDGKLDDVFDTDGDGSPDYFIPAGKTKGVPITVERDVNGDGFLDWTYDANRDGKDDHFYDPAAQTGGNEIDTAAEFIRSLQQYWYVGGLFILVAALFVVLIAVTRR